MGRSQRKTERAKGEREKEREGMLLEELREQELTERCAEKERKREREGKAGILKAAVTPVTSHLSNPAPT